MDAFSNIWDLIMLTGAIASGAVSLLIFIVYLFRSGSIRDPKSKYDFVSTKEVKYFWYSIIFIAIGVFFISNSIHSEDRLTLSWFIIRFVISIPIATLVAYIPYLLLKYTYPGPLNRRLKRIRYKPRFSPEGRKMRLLSEDEEDVHLDEGMIAEENIFSVDYDVWIDEMTGYTKIEKYPGHLEASKCDRCNMQTLKVEREEITRKPTNDEDGELIKHYKCTYCGRIRRKAVVVAKLSQDAEHYKLPSELHFKDEERGNVEAIKIEIYTDTHKPEIYEFPSVDQAKQFLEKYEPTQVEE